MKSAYGRTSTNRQDLASQIALCQAAAGNDAVVYEDAAISGKNDNREGINRLLQDARAGKVSVVYISELSRIGRSQGFIHSTVEELTRLGIDVVLAKSGMRINTKTLEGRALLGGLALAADIEHCLICERNERGRIRMKEKGSQVGRKPKAISFEALRALAAQGKSAGHIAKEMGVSKATIIRRFKSIGLCYKNGGYLIENRTDASMANCEMNGINKEL